MSWRSRFRSRASEYQPLPLSTLSSPASPLPAPTLSRSLIPRRNRYTLILLVLILVPFLTLFGSRHSSHLEGYVRQGHERMAAWTGASEGKVWVEKVNEWGGNCRGWDPDKPELEDPVDCLKARQYRQTMRVLEREERAEQYVTASFRVRRGVAWRTEWPSPHWFFTLQHNRETFRNVSRCFLPTWHTDYTRCIDKPLVISGWWYTAETITGATTGGEQLKLFFSEHSANSGRGHLAILSGKLSLVQSKKASAEILGQAAQNAWDELCRRRAVRELGRGGRDDARRLERIS